ncbi:hypothetical protein THIX_10029 [Thiomonas sp. X19]|uniref:hypothetical protein n=1 Tax=Thiomonas sp. X19 TaxID=1050370 RepID=UPI000B6E817C|nr:hypothetical protein [Thiomonas sp. X19]SCC90988.1 hypothetical protein THIX_10029 [Thiomonas sp. X19]
MSESKKRRAQSLQPRITCTRLLGPNWIAQTDDPDYAWEVPRRSVEINVNDAVAQKLTQVGGLEDYSPAFYCDPMGRMYAVLGLVAARRLIVVAVPAQDEHGKRWLEESAQYGDFAISVRYPSNGASTTVYFDNKKSRENDARYNELFVEAITRAVDERTRPAGALEHMAGVLTDALARPHLSRGLKGVHFFSPDCFVQ